MNSTQKSGWLLLLAFLLGAVTFAYVGSVFVFGRIPPRPFSQIVVGSVGLGGFMLLGLTILLLTRRQSRAEPEADERDKAIMAKAAAISFAGSWLLLAAVVLILGITLGQTGTIPVYLLTVILLGVAVATMLIYGVAILVQYGRAGKGGRS